MIEKMQKIADYITDNYEFYEGKDDLVQEPDLVIEKDIFKNLEIGKYAFAFFSEELSAFKRIDNEKFACIDFEGSKERLHLTIENWNEAGYAEETEADPISVISEFENLETMLLNCLDLINYRSFYG